MQEIKSANGDLGKKLSQEAKRLGFIKTGFLRADRPLFFEEFHKWVNEERYGGMVWLKKTLNLRAHPNRVLKGCRYIISLAYPYSKTIPCTEDGLRAARYTEGLAVDYHYRLKALARPLVDIIKREFPDSRSRVCVDSAPLLERSLAYASGVGFFGKNNMLIIPGYGSYFYLVEIVTTAPLQLTSNGPLDEGCGSCTRCLENCPSGALEGPFLTNAGKCLSYLTIECKDPVTKEIGLKMGNCFFGCDMCQEVCPHNKGDNPMNRVLPHSRDILALDQQGYEQLFGKTAFARAGLEKLKSNIRAVIGIT